MKKKIGSYTLTYANNQYTQAIKEVVFEVLEEYQLEVGEIDACLENVETNYFQNKGCFLVLLDAQGKVVGTGGLFYLNAATAELRKMYLLPQHRGKGLGKATMLSLLDEARNLGYKRVTLETASVLKEAIGLYKKYGFQEIKSDHLPERCDQAYELIL